MRGRQNIRNLRVSWKIKKRRKRHTTQPSLGKLEQGLYDAAAPFVELKKEEKNVKHEIFLY